MSNRRTSELSRRGHWRKDVSLFVLFTVACAVLAVVQLAERLWPLAVLGLVAVVVYRTRRARRISRPSRVIQGRAEPAGIPTSEVGQLRAERDELRRQIAKLEQDAAEHDNLLERLERVTRRPVELHLADLERAQRLYGPATTGKSGRRS